MTASIKKSSITAIMKNQGKFVKPRKNVKNLFLIILKLKRYVNMQLKKLPLLIRYIPD